MVQTEFEFRLPIGYQDPDGTLHREGTMRLATAADEILPLRDARVQSNEAYLIVILLSRVVTRLGSVEAITPRVIENLYAADMAHLQEFYNSVNHNGSASVETTCPRCEHVFRVGHEPSGELLATPSAGCSRR